MQHLTSVPRTLSATDRRRPRVAGYGNCGRHGNGSPSGSASPCVPCPCKPSLVLRLTRSTITLQHLLASTASLALKKNSHNCGIAQAWRARHNPCGAMPSHHRWSGPRLDAQYLTSEHGEKKRECRGSTLLA